MREKTIQLDETDWRIIRALKENARATFTEIGRAVGLTSPAARERVRRMEEAGLIARRRKDGNRRSLYVSLTPRGAEMARKMDEAAREVDRLAASLLSADEEELLKNMLASVRRAMTETEEK